ncbi:hypothetical protein [Proteiniphilum acetatigenes]|uniref:hypothetical protein n=1 Tax=Proteiniphilum acetatigenes TaxID=294710 RepID=UPI001FE0AF72|nr:hypothetical protein [Proteiniphilum acetatigenes]
MKKRIYIIWSILLAIGLNSCDLDIDPTDAVSSDIVFDNAGNAEKVLNGTWAYLMDTYTTYQNPGWSSVLLTSDAMANDVAVQPGKYGYLVCPCLCIRSRCSLCTHLYGTVDKLY